jgi:TonB family protein
MWFRALCILLVVPSAVVCKASIESPGRVLALTSRARRDPFAQTGIFFRDMSSLGATTGSCEVSSLPQALATPDPLLAASGSRDRVAVSFIIGADGQVHSPVILESAGSPADHNVLQTLRSWRYRPALCNAVPAETESRVEFSSR